MLVGILLLIVELDQNREMMRAQVRHDVASQTIDEIRAVATDAVLADILVRMNSAYDQVLEMSKRHNTDLRTGAFILAIDRVVRTLSLRGFYP